WQQHGNWAQLTF
nr:immunoglobulin light chain junction region [Macaca mulatta]